VAVVEEKEKEMSTIFQTISIVLSLVPALIAAIRAIEEAIPGQGQGEAKLAAVREIIEAVYGQAFNLWPIIQNVIGILVATFNKVGVFVKSDPA
jgi:hypothetical protein